MESPPLPLLMADQVISALLRALTSDGLLYLATWLVVLAATMALPAAVGPLPMKWAGKPARILIATLALVLAALSALGGIYGDA